MELHIIFHIKCFWGTLNYFQCYTEMRFIEIIPLRLIHSILFSFKATDLWRWLVYVLDLKLNISLILIYNLQVCVCRLSFVICRLSAQFFNNNFTTSGCIFKVEGLYERYIHGKQMCQNIFFIGATPRAHGPVLHIIDFFEKNKITF